MSKLNKRFGKTVFDKPREFVHSGNLALDCIVSGKYDGTGGIPIGAIVELAGRSQTGKTLIAAKVGAEFQKRGGYVFFNDAECTYDVIASSNIGLDHTNIADDGTFYYDRINIIEEFGNAAIEFCHLVHEDHPELPICIILDSLGVMRSAAEAEQGLEYEDFGRRAKQTKLMLRNMLPIMAETNATFIIVNHVYMTMAAMGPKETTGGGLATDYNTTLRIMFHKAKKYPDNKSPEGVIMKAKVVKSKLNYEKEGQTCEFSVSWKDGPLKYTGLLPLLVEEVDGLECAGGWYVYREHKFRASDFATNPDDFFRMFKKGGEDAKQECE